MQILALPRNGRHDRECCSVSTSTDARPIKKPCHFHNFSSQLEITATAAFRDALDALKNFIAVPLAGLRTKDVVANEVEVIDLPRAHDDLLASVQEGPHTFPRRGRGVQAWS